LAHVIDDDLVGTPGRKAVAYSTVTRYFHEAEVIFDPEQCSPHVGDSDRAILAAMKEKPFSFVRELARATHIATVVFISGHDRFIQGKTHHISQFVYEPMGQSKCDTTCGDFLAAASRGSPATRIR
jgi:hypothetical protein